MHKRIEANSGSSKFWDYVNTDRIKKELDEDEYPNISDYIIVETQLPVDGNPGAQILRKAHKYDELSDDPKQSYKMEITT